MRKTNQSSVTALLVLLMAALACNIPGSASTEVPQMEVSTVTPAQLSSIPIEAVPSPTTPAPVPSSTPVPVEIIHLMTPTDSPKVGTLIFDVRSDGTAPEKRAPYGDAYNINRFERPFLQDMTYVSDMDILSYNVSSDADWYYFSIELIGSDPNNSLGIHYGVELDLNWDGYGDYVIWGSPPYSTTWTTDTVQVFKDDNKDTAGLSPARSDAPLEANGYETLIFDRGAGDDPDLAWMRVGSGERSTVQFAVKKALIGAKFMFGVVADGGLKDVTSYDYNDRFLESEAGSPEINEPYYPLKALFGVDNSCQSAIGFDPSGFEPKLCPVEPTPTPKKPGGGPGPTPGCPAPSYCSDWDSTNCICLDLY